MRQELRLAITGLDDEGRGVGAADGLEVHVAGALPGETVRAAIEHRSPHAPRAWATLCALESEPAQERVEPACPNHGRCGGCLLQHLAYPAQLTEKRRAVERALPRHEVADVIASPHEIRYRNKAKYVAARQPLILGSYLPASHDVVDMAGCRVVETPIDRAATAFRAAAAAAVPVYDERARTGELRHVVLRANADGEVLVVAVTRTAAPTLTKLAKTLDVAGVVQHVNPHPGAAIYARDGRDLVLAGAGTLADTVGDVRLELSARAFFQVNRPQAARLYGEVARLAGAKRGLRVVDLYCGVGGIALTLAARGARVVGVEVSPEAVADARRSAHGRAAFHAADAATGLPAAVRELGGLDVLVVNPPRKGLDAAARAAILAAAPPRIIYVSCGPRSLAADLDALSAWRVTAVHPFDLMPGTPHVETVVALERK